LIAISRSLAGFGEVQFRAQKTGVIGATKFGCIKHMFLRKLRIYGVGLVGGFGVPSPARQY
jgi:hypothetical protein